jgi:hypothetical protein
MYHQTASKREKEEEEEEEDCIARASERLFARSPFLLSRPFKEIRREIQLSLYLPVQKDAYDAWHEIM